MAQRDSIPVEWWNNTTHDRVTFDTAFAGLEWHITAKDQLSFDKAFASLDTTKKGYLTGELPPILSSRVLMVGSESVEFFLESKLPDEVLTSQSTRDSSLRTPEQMSFL